MMKCFVLGYLATTIPFVIAIYSPSSDNIYPTESSILVSIQTPSIPLSKHVCGGVIISPEHVLTSADCVTRNANIDRLMAGSMHLNSDGTLHLITEKLIHEGYEKDSNINNIAIVKVSPKFDFGDSINMADLQTQKVLEGIEVKFLGWGAYNSTAVFSTSGAYSLDYFYSDVLQTVTLKIISNEKCNDYRLNVSDEQLCTLTHIGRGLCEKDQGGPLLIDAGSRKKKVLAIATNRYSCGSGFPDVYTKIAPFMEWIHTTCQCQI